MQKILYFPFALFLCFLAISSSSGANIGKPLVHWGLDGNGKDSIGNNDLSIEGGDFEQGKYGQALSLDGSGVHAVDEEGANYINGLESITIALWVKSNQTNTDKGFLDGVDPEGSDRYLCIRYDAAGSIAGGVNLIKTGVNTDQGKTTLESSNDVQTTEWQHIVMVWKSGEQLKLYINGVEDLPTANEAAIGGKLSDLTKIIVGKGAKDQSGGWDGLIDDVYIYSEALNANEIVEVMGGKALTVDIQGKLSTLWGEMKEIKQYGGRIK